MTQIEIWKDLKGYEGIFRISNYKRLYRYSYYDNSKVPEQYWSEQDYVRGRITVTYRNLPYMFDMKKLLKEYFNPDEIIEGTPPEAGVMSLKDEIWKTIKNFEGFQVSNKGRIKRLANETNGVHYSEYIVKTHKVFNSNVVMVTLWSENTGKVERIVALLVAEAFIENPFKYTIVKHLNGILGDNCVENLAWIPNNDKKDIKCLTDGAIYHSVSEVCETFGFNRNEFEAALKSGEAIQKMRFIDIKAEQEKEKEIKDVPIDKMLTPKKSGEVMMKPILNLFNIKEKPEIKNHLFETWKDIPDFKEFQVSNYGRVKRKAGFKDGRIVREELQKLFIPKNSEYMHVSLFSSHGVEEKAVHELVAKLFVRNPYNFKYIGFKDKDKTNLNASNLEWLLSPENSVKVIRCKENGLYWDSIASAAREMNLDYQKLRNAIIKNTSIDNKHFKYDTIRKAVETIDRGVNKMKQEWKEVPGYEGKVYVSNDEKIKTITSRGQGKGKAADGSYLLKMRKRANGDAYAVTTLGTVGVVSFNATQLAKELFGSKSEKVTKQEKVTKPDFQPLPVVEFQEKLKTIVNNWDSYSPSYIKAELLKMAEETPSTKVLAQLRESLNQTFDKFMKV